MSEEQHASPIILKATTRIPRMFNAWGTLIYGVASLTALAFIISAPWWTPPWWALLPTYAYVFVSTGIICWGRIENNRDNRLFIEALKHQSEINKQRMN